MFPKPSLEDPKAPITAPHLHVLRGNGFISEIEKGGIENVTMLIAGAVDFELRCAFYYQWAEQKLPGTVEDILRPKVTQALDRYKYVWREALKQAIDMEERAEQTQQENQRQRRFEQASSDFKAMSQPAPEGTVDELSKRYGVSKSHVRTLKREGRLHELVSQST